MRARPLPRVPGRSEQAVKDALEAQRREARNSPFSQGKQFNNIVVPTVGSVTVHHALGFVPRTIHISAPRGSEGPVFEASRDKTSLVLSNTGAADATVDVWVS